MLSAGLFTCVSSDSLTHRRDNLQDWTAEASPDRLNPVKKPTPNSHEPLFPIPPKTYCGVLGLVTASPVSLLIQTDMSGATAFIMLISIATFAAGFAGAFLLAKNSKE